jgi:hypothetical protein
MVIRGELFYVAIFMYYFLDQLKIQVIFKQIFIHIYVFVVLLLFCCCCLALIKEDVQI